MSRGALLPLVPLYRLALAAREFRLCAGFEPVRRLRCPVISIGNLSTGGSGKTPLTIALAKALGHSGPQVDVLSRGYGRNSRLPAQVDPHGSAAEFGDEPLLIARQANVPVYVASRRFDAGMMAEREGAGGVHLLDDGFQHRQLYREIDILLVNRQDWHDHLLPAGNLREPIAAARRATILATPDDEPEFESELRKWGWQGPIWRLRRRMEIPQITEPVVAFCGIARPEQFFAGLQAAGLRVAVARAFPDHHRFTRPELERLASGAHTAGAKTLVTTEKDAVRLGELASSFPIRPIHFKVEIVEEDQAVGQLLDRLRPVLAHSSL